MPEIDSITVMMRCEYAGGGSSECSTKTAYDNANSVGGSISFVLHGISPSRELACLAEAVTEHCGWERMSNPLNKDEADAAGAFIEAARAYARFWEDFDKKLNSMSDSPAVRAAEAMLAARNQP